MTPEQQRIAIAEACGWVREYADVPTWDASLKSYKPVSTLLFRREVKCVLAENLPDYLNDLNAMHAAEKILTHEQADSFTEVLWSQKSGDKPVDSYIWSATAAQRAEAFLRTLKLWKE